MRRLLLIGGVLAGLVLLVLGALYAAPLFTDWTARRDTLAALAAERLGRPVTLTGPVRLRLLPRPVVEAEGVTLGEPDDAFAVTAGALRLRLDGPALLRGRLAPREVALVGADIRLPWPPPGGAAGLFAGLSSLDAALEGSRIAIGAVVLERVQARLTAGDGSLAAPVRAGGSFVRGGLEWRFDATLGRPGFDGATPLEVALALGGATIGARGVLTPEGVMEGSVEASGPDLSLLVPAPAGPFRARGRLMVAADLVAADELAMDLGGGPARGALTLRLSPTARVDVALVTGRLDLDSWVGALRSRGAGLPLGVDLSAEAASFGGVPLRRLRAAVFRDADRLTLTDVSALLPGDTTVELNGATAGDRLEAGLRFAGSDLRGTLGALGLNTEVLAPARLRAGEGRARLVLDPGSVAVPEFSAVLDGARVSGAGVLRYGARPALGLGLNLDVLDLDAWLRPGLDWAAAGRVLGGLDANLRIAAETARWGGVGLDRASLDASLENGRLTVRRLSGRLAEAELALSGGVLLGPSPRLSDASLELSGPAFRSLAMLLPGSWPDGTRLAGQGFSLRAGGSGPVEALAVQLGLDLGEARLEANTTLDLPGRRGTGTVTLRHPGAPRFLSEAGWPGVEDWIGQGSLSVVAALSAGPQGVSAERLELVAGGVRLSGPLALTLEAGRPRVTGRLAVEAMNPPGFAWRGREPLPVAALRGLDADVALSFGRLELAGLPPVQDARARVRLSAGRLALDEVEAVLSGGALRGAATLDVTGDAPVLGLSGTVRDAEVTGPMLGLPVDVVAGRAELGWQLAARGSSAAALIATLEGEARLAARQGVLSGLDAAAAGRGAVAGDETALRQALSDGATGFEALSVRGTLAGGRVTLAEASAVGEGVALTLRGDVDVARGAVDLLATQKPGDPGYSGPEVGVRLTGPAARPRRVPEVAAWQRWRAER
ncbi:AsmA family protein [Muricoccus radiodurans]|uniref:AsmA family protein n=1 Tax=Muricoccus radiodurans TaxID=2231721 RepID=UPI003CF2BB1F